MNTLAHDIVVPFQSLSQITERGTQRAVREGKSEANAKRYLEALENHNAKRIADHAWQAYFEGLNSEFNGRIAAVRCRLNDWEKQLGLGLLSVTMEPLDRRDAPIDMQGARREWKAPTDGIIGSIAAHEEQILAAFAVAQGGEELTNIGKNPLIINDVGDPDTPVEKIHVRGIATLRAAVTDRAQLLKASAAISKAEFSYRDIDEEEALVLAAQRYMCRFLKAGQ